MVTMIINDSPSIVVSSRLSDVDFGIHSCFHHAIEVLRLNAGGAEQQPLRVHVNFDFLDARG